MLVALLGSSSVAEAAPLPGALAASWGVEVRADGRVGWTPVRWSEAIEANPAELAALVAGASLLVVYLPANGSPSSASVSRLDATLRARVRVPVVWLRPPQFPASSAHAERIEAWDRAIVAAGVRALPRPPPLRNGDVRADGLHLTREGAYRVAMTPNPLEVASVAGGVAGGGDGGLVLAIAALALLAWVWR